MTVYPAGQPGFADSILTVSSCSEALIAFLDFFFHPQELIIIGGEKMPAIAHSQVIKIIDLGRIEGGFDAGMTRAADGCGREAFVQIGIIRRVNLEITVAEDILPLRKGVLNSSIDLKEHVLLEPVEDNRRD